MRIPVRRALIAAAITALALPSAASASCLPICDDELYALMDALLAGQGGDGSATLCAYAKLTPGPPPGWTGDPDSPPPYIWVETEDWGEQNEGQYQRHQCVYACEVESSPLPETPDPSGPPSLTPVRDAAACAAPLLP